MTTRLRAVLATAGFAAGMLAIAAPALAAVPTGANPQNLPVASCFWTGPFTNVDPRTNQGFPGQVMGPYYPTGYYTSQAAFQAKGGH